MQDVLFVFSDGQSDVGADQASDYYMDLTGGTDGKDAFGNAIKVPIADNKLYLNVLVTTAIASAVLTVDLYTASDTTITSADTKICGLQIPSGAVAGSCWSVGVPATDATWLRYIGVVYDAASSAPTGAVDCWLGLSPVSGNKLPH